MLETILLYLTLMIALLALTTCAVMASFNKSSTRDHERDLLDSGFVKTPIRVDLGGEGYALKWEWRKQFHNQDNGGQH